MIVEMDPQKYSYRVYWDEADGLFRARVDEYPHLGASHPDKPEEALKTLQTRVFAELQWWMAEGEPPPRPSDKPPIVQCPAPHALGVLYWDRFVWEPHWQHLPDVSSTIQFFDGRRGHDRNLCNSSGYTESAYETFTHLGLRLGFSQPELLERALRDVRVEFYTHGRYRAVELPASALIDPKEEGGEFLPHWKPNETSDGWAPREFTHCGFIALPEPQTLPPRSGYGVQLHLDRLFCEKLQRLQTIIRHDNRACSYAELCVFLYGRRRERLL